MTSTTAEISEMGTLRTTPPLAQAFRLGPWKVFPQLNKLESDSGRLKSIEPRLMHLLCYLAANVPEVIDRETLVEQLWPHVVVNENSLTRAVSELRKQLRGECEDIAPAIETIPKRGYRLNLAPSALELTTNISQIQAAELQTPAIRLILPIQAKTLAIAATLALALGVTLPSLFTSLRNGSENITLTDELIASSPTFEGGEITLSTAQSDVITRSTSTRPVISHDGLTYAYLRYDHSGSTVFLGDLGKMTEPYPIYHNQDKLINLAWSPIGDSLLFARKPNMTTAALFPKEAQEQELLVLDIANNEVRRLVKDERAPDLEIVRERNLT